jgi:hypothetical protein
VPTSQVVCLAAFCRPRQKRTVASTCAAVTPAMALRLLFTDLDLPGFSVCGGNLKIP